jgi:hypothetical protein
VPAAVTSADDVSDPTRSLIIFAPFFRSPWKENAQPYQLDFGFLTAGHLSKDLINIKLTGIGEYK